jgi:hypothetical protein
MSCVRRERWTEDLTLDFDPGERLQRWRISIRRSEVDSDKADATYSFLNILKVRRVKLWCWFVTRLRRIFEDDARDCPAIT